MRHLVEFVSLEEFLHQLVDFFLTNLCTPVVLELVLNIAKFLTFLKKQIIS
jgi:hypothetical protein